MPEYYSTGYAAEKLGISVRRVQKLLKEGRIKGMKLGRIWLVERIGYTRKTKWKGNQIDRGVVENRKPFNNCLRCGYEWPRKTDERPLRCAKCRSVYWDRPRKRK